MTSMPPKGKIKFIAQTRITDLVLREEELKDLRRKIKTLESEIATARLTLFADLESGVRVEAGRYTLSLENKEGASRPPWKEIYLEHFVKEHNQSRKEAENNARLMYPGETERVLIVGISPH
jgi:hypothetical protein